MRLAEARDAAHRWEAGAQRAGLNGSVPFNENMQVKNEEQVSEALVPETEVSNGEQESWQVTDAKKIGNWGPQDSQGSQRHSSPKSDDFWPGRPSHLK